MSAFTRMLGSGLTVLLVLGGAGCKSAQEEAKTFKRCGHGQPCKKPNVCIRAGKSNEGICVYPCMQDDNCPQPFRCTGGYRLHGKNGLYCRKPSVGVGEDCSRIQDGCKKGLRCFNNKCITLCAKDDDCPKKTDRCIQVVDDSPFKSNRKNLYRGCLDAPQQQEQSCKPSGPFCARDHICHRDKCLKTCKDDKVCGKDQICDGTFYTGKDAKQRAEANAKPDILYCRKAGAKNAYCNLSVGKSCARGLYCLGSRCREITRAKLGKRCREMRGIFCEKGAMCYAGKCRQICKVDQDCKRSRRRKGKCQERTISNQKVGLCM